MEFVRLQLRRYLKAAWQRRWLSLGTAWVVCAIGWVGVYMIPNQYQASARLYVDADAVLTPLLKGVAADSNSTSQIDILQRTLLSGPNLEQLVSKTDLDLTLSSAADRERLIQDLATEIKIKPQTKTLFSIEYRNTDPKLALAVVRTLLDIFISKATGANRADMENARHFIDQQIAGYELQLRGAERRRAEFRTHYLSILPQDDGREGGGSTRLDQLRAQVVTLDGQLQDAIIRRDGLKRELAATPPAIAAPVQAAMGGDGGRLAQAEEQLRDLRLRYTDEYPDVIAARALVASLRASPPASGGGGGRGSVSRPGGSSVVYDQMKLKLVDAEASVTSLKRQLDDATKDRDSVEQLAKQAPGVLAQYKALDRDYSVIKRNYEELLGRREATQLAEAAELQADKVKLTTVDPPQVGRIPVAPNRVLLVTVVLFAGLGLGTALSLLLGQFDRSFRTIDDLRAIGLPVLGGISALGVAVSPRRIASTFGFCVGFAALIIVFGGLLAHVLRSQAMV